MKKSYYAIIPANVRYDKRLRDKAKLLYGEITALCNEKGYCWATNNYFAELYGVSKVTISSLINELKKYGYINIKLKYKENSKEIEQRCITILPTPIKENFNTPIKENFNTPIKENFKENNTINNNTIFIDNKNIYSPANTGQRIPFEKIIDYLNKKTNSNYKSKTEKTKRLIKARFNEGFNFNDFKIVIDKKVSEWYNSDMQKYLRPETLFGNKFESYLNQQTKIRKKDIDEIDEAFERLERRIANDNKRC